MVTLRRPGGGEQGHSTGGSMGSDNEGIVAFSLRMIRKEGAMTEDLESTGLRKGYLFIVLFFKMTET